MPINQQPEIESLLAENSKREPNNYLGYFTRLQPDIILPKDTQFFNAYCQRDSLIAPADLHYFCLSGYRTADGKPIIINSIGKVDKTMQWSKYIPFGQGNPGAIRTEPVPYDIRKFLSQTEDTVNPAKQHIFKAKFYSVPLDDVINFSDNIRCIQAEYEKHYEKKYEKNAEKISNPHRNPESMSLLHHYELVETEDDNDAYTFHSTQLENILDCLIELKKIQLFEIEQVINNPRHYQLKEPSINARVKLYYFLKKTSLNLPARDINEETKLPNDDAIKKHSGTTHLNFIFQMYEYIKLLHDFEQHKHLFNELGGKRSCDYVKPTLAKYLDKYIRFLTDNFTKKHIKTLKNNFTIEYDKMFKDTLNQICLSKNSEERQNKKEILTKIISVLQAHIDLITIQKTFKTKLEKIIKEKRKENDIKQLLDATKEIIVKNEINFSDTNKVYIERLNSQKEILEKKAIKNQLNNSDSLKEILMQLAQLSSDIKTKLDNLEQPLTAVLPQLLKENIQRLKNLASLSDKIKKNDESTFKEISELSNYIGKLNTLKQHLEEENSTEALEDNSQKLEKLEKLAQEMKTLASAWETMEIEIDESQKLLHISKYGFVDGNQPLEYIHNFNNNCFHFADRFFNQKLPSFNESEQEPSHQTENYYHEPLKDPGINKNTTFPDFPEEVIFQNGYGAYGAIYYPRPLPANWETEQNFYRYSAAEKLNTYLSNSSIQTLKNKNKHEKLKILLQLHDAILDNIRPSNHNPKTLENILLKEGLYNRQVKLTGKAQTLINKTLRLAKYERNHINYKNAHGELNKAYTTKKEKMDKNLKKWIAKLCDISKEIIDEDPEKKVLHTKIFNEMKTLLTCHSKIIAHCDKSGKIPEKKYEIIKSDIDNFRSAYSALHDTMPSQVRYETKNRDKLIVVAEICAGLMISGIAAALTFLSLGIATPVTTVIFAAGATLTTAGIIHTGKLIHTAFFAKPRKREKKVCELLEDGLRAPDIFAAPVKESVFKKI